MDFNNENDIMSAFMASKTHRENILNPQFKEIGVAVKNGVINKKYTTLMVLLFGASGDQILAVSKENASLANLNYLIGDKTAQIFMFFALLLFLAIAVMILKIKKSAPIQLHLKFK
jgi:hypothetical protein